MSSFSTFSPSLEQTYCCFSRAPSFLCSWSSLMYASYSSAAEYSNMGMETSPNERVAEAMGVADMCVAMIRSHNLLASGSEELLLLSIVLLGRFKRRLD